MDAEKLTGLDVLDDDRHIIVEYAGEKLRVAPLTLGQLTKFSRRVRPIVDSLVSGDHPEWSDEDVLLIELLELHGEDLFEAAAIAVNKPVEFIAGNSNGGQMVELARAIVQMNADFFTRAVRASAAMARRRTAVVVSASGSGTGSTTSNSSSESVATD